MLYNLLLILCKVVSNEHIIQKYGLNKSLNQNEMSKHQFSYLPNEKIIPVLTISTQYQCILQIAKLILNSCL